MTREKQKQKKNSFEIQISRQNKKKMFEFQIVG